MLEPFQDLIDHYRSGRLIVFIGAGASASVTWASEGQEMRGLTWPELVDEAAKLLGLRDASLLRVRGTDLQILEYFRRTRGNISELVNLLVRQMNPSDEALRASTIHTALASLSRSRLVYTTNYDDFIERSLGLRGVPTIGMTTEAHFAEAFERRATGEDQLVEVVKFHGDWNNPDAMVLSEKDYEERLRMESHLDRRFYSDLIGRAVLFLGYGFRDWNVSYLFRLLNDRLARMPASSHGRRAFIAVADPSKFERSLYEARNIEVIPTDSSNLTEGAARILKELELNVQHT